MLISMEEKFEEAQKSEEETKIYIIDYSRNSI